MKLSRLVGTLAAILILAIGATAPSDVFAKGNRDMTYVMVELNVGFAPEGALKDKRAVSEQRKKIHDAREHVIRHLDGFEYEVTAEFETIPYVGLAVSGDAAGALKRSKDVARVVVEERQYAHLTGTVPMVQADLAQTLGGVNGAGFSVAILDTGVNSAHPFLAGKVVAEACFTDFNCPNGANMQVGPGAAAPCTQSGCDHGTHVAGIAAGLNTNWLAGQPRRGTASGATIIAVQVFSADEISGEIYTMPHNYIKGLEWVYLLHQSPEFDVAAANMSLGGGHFLTPCDLEPAKVSVDALRAAGVATVASSGNDGYKNGMSAPACISTVVSVGSVNPTTDTVVASSNSAPFLDLLAPGGGVVSSDLSAIRYGQKFGTSMAAPHVAGAMAILRENDPAATVDFLQLSLMTNGVQVTDSQNNLTHPRLLVFPALAGPTTPGMPPAATTCNGLAATIIGTAGPDILVGTAGVDVILGLAGDDIIDAGAGDDVICAGDGQDTVIAGTGDDTVMGGAGNDTLWGGDDQDTLSGESGDDVIYGESDDDVLSGGFGNDTLWGGADDDRLNGDKGWDTLHGGDGSDSLSGGDGNDTLHGDDGVDRLRGNDGDDTLWGGAGNDNLSGNDGADALHGQTGDDTLNGGANNDWLLGENNNDTLTCGGGWDTADGGFGTDSAAGDCESIVAVP
jgi:subtilisin family serine protease